MWKNSDEFLLLSVWMLYVISEFIPEFAKNAENKQNGKEREMETEMRMCYYTSFHTAIDVLDVP